MASPESVNSALAASEASTFLAHHPAPFGLQRFLSKKGISSPEQLNDMVRKYAPRISWRRRKFAE